MAPLLHDLVRRSAAQRPDHLAVLDASRRLTYAELDAGADRVAARLRRRGLGAERVVGVLAGRRVELVVAVVGILRAGGAYLPMDPSHPDERLDYMLADADVEVVLATGDLAARAGALARPAVVLDEVLGEAAEPGPEPAVRAHQLAYVLYTSGSTGRPKGVCVEHGSIAEYVDKATELFAMTAEDRVLQFSSVGFDPFFSEVFPALSTGAAVLLRPDGMIDSVQRFVRVVERERLTVLNVPTAYWHELAAALRSGHVELPDRVRLAVVGGERALPARLADWYAAAPPGAALVHVYGPTETTVAVTAAELQPPPQGAAAAVEEEVPIGRPMRGVRAYVLDPEGRRVGDGEVGELHIAGSCLARGYVNDPELTAERFLEHPAFLAQESRVYRTGDLVRWRPDGALEFVGRADGQVQLRGMRVELGEVEQALALHPSMRQVAVVMREDGGAKRLIAYCSLRPEATEPGRAELRAFLLRTLPPFMVPVDFVTLEQLPLNANDKVDRAALPAPSAVARARDRPMAEPRTRLECDVATIWESVLQVGHVGRDERFVDLGGDSLGAIEILSELHAAYRCDLTLDDLRTADTVADIARLVERSTRELVAEPGS
jgi:amino acid adenylation domain-containing protein